MRSALSILCILYSSLISGQEVLNQRISKDFSNKTILQSLYELESELDVTFFFEPERIPFYSLDYKAKDEVVHVIMKNILKGSNLRMVPVDVETFAILDFKDVTSAHKDSLVARWKRSEYSYPKKKEVQEITLNLGREEMNSSSEYKLVVDVLDEFDDPLIGVSINDTTFHIAEITNELGRSQLLLPRGRTTLYFQSVGKKTVIITVYIYEHSKISVLMENANYVIDEVVITGQSRKDQIQSARSGAEIVSLASVKSTPQLLGEPDLIKNLELLPGVTSAGEASAGYNVRGGKIDENLILYNDAIIFNPTHALGLASAINTDMVQTATLYKAYQNGELGGRTSSALILESKLSDQDKFVGEGSVSTGIAKLSLQPRISKSTRLKFGGRYSYTSWLLDTQTNPIVSNSKLNFYDYNILLEQDLGSKNKVRFSRYESYDNFRFNDEYGFSWRNIANSLQLRNQIGNKITLITNASLGSFNTDQFTLNTSDSYSYLNAMNYYKVNSDLSYYVDGSMDIKIGGEFIRFDPDNERLESNGDISQIESSSLVRNSSDNLAFYLNIRKDFFENLEINTSLRLNNYTAKGEWKEAVFEDDDPISGSIVDFITYEKGETISSEWFLEPRLSLKYNFTPQFAAKSSYTYLTQNIHQLTTTSSALPTDLWVLSNSVIPIQKVHQGTFGVFYQAPSEIYQISVDAFYKRLYDSFVLDDFSNIILNEAIEKDIVLTDGESYGIEVLVEKLKGKFSGTLAATYSRTFLQSADESRNFNSKQKFSALYDIPLQVNLAIQQTLNPTISFNYLYTFKSGRPFTTPQAFGSIHNINFPLYSLRNEGRLGYYSRLDVSMQLDFTKIKRRGFKNSFAFGFYNILGRKNPYNIFFNSNQFGNLSAYQFSYLGSVIPFLSWNFEF